MLGFDLNINFKMNIIPINYRIAVNERKMFAALNRQYLTLPQDKK